MFDRRIEIVTFSEVRDEYNERTLELRQVAVCYAQRTESGGRENLFASRILHENEVAYTLRYREGLKAGQFVREEGSLQKIISIHEEGRRKYLHLKTVKSDVESQN